MGLGCRFARLHVVGVVVGKLGAVSFIQAVDMEGLARGRTRVMSLEAVSQDFEVRVVGGGCRGHRRENLGALSLGVVSFIRAMQRIISISAGPLLFLTWKFHCLGRRPSSTPLPPEALLVRRGKKGRNVEKKQQRRNDRFKGALAS